MTNFRAFKRREGMGYERGSEFWDFWEEESDEEAKDIRFSSKVLKQQKTTELEKGGRSRGRTLSEVLLQCNGTMLGSGGLNSYHCK